MTRKKRILLFLTGIVLLTGLCSAGVLAFGFLGIQSLGRTGTSSPTPTAQTPTSSPTATVTSTPTPAPVCGGPPVMDVLLIGSDTRASSYYVGLADSIRIVRVDFVHPGIMTLAFQRDLYVKIPDIASHYNITHGKLNQAYLYGNPGFGYYDGPGQGPGLLAKTLQLNFGTQADHYVAVNLQTFQKVVDALGGIDIDLPHAVDGRTGPRDNTRYFPAGPQHLDGYRTMILARMRPDGDLERTSTQDLILQALAARMLTPDALPRLPELVESFYGSIQTDMGATEISQLLCLGSMLNPRNIRNVNFPDDIFKGSRVQDPVLGYTFVWNVDFNLLRAYVQYFNNGSWPQSPLPAQ